MNDHHVRECKAHADFYRSIGLQPLPSSIEPGGKKKPLCKFKEFWTEPAPADLFDRFPTTNIQLMTGRFWGFCVLDFDSPSSVEYAAKEWPPLPRTWIVESGGKGLHYWFATPPAMPETRKCFLWKGSGEHEGIELLCDGSLATAPPSFHLKTGRRYAFRSGFSPRDVPRLAELPRWVLGKIPRPKAAVPVRIEPRRAIPKMEWRWTIDELMDAVHDKASVAAGWGLRFADRPCESDGWVSVHDFNRPDANPSARFHLGTGGFWRPGENVIPFLRLGAAMGVYSSWREAGDDLASRYLRKVHAQRFRERSGSGG